METSRNALFKLCTVAALLLILLPLRAASPPARPMQPTNLQCESLTEPLGADAPRPMLSWRLRDSRWGARQTAYEVTVYRRKPTRAAETPDLWDSGKIASDASTGVAYGGPALAPETRYFWRVRLWDMNGKPYPLSGVTWWETGLMSQASWHAQWIGYEDPELHAIRDSGAAWITNPAAPAPIAGDTRHDFRFAFTLPRPVRRAVLYAAGEDTPAAWLNGLPVMQPQRLPRWQRLPWGTYTRQDVTAAVHAGSNLLAIAVTRYAAGGKTSPARTPMSACLYIVFADGSSSLFTSSSPGWKAALNAADGWSQPDFADASWLPPETYRTAPASESEGDGGLPWPTGPVAALRRGFPVDKAVVSARLYATALGAYAFRINGAAVGDQILAPGWMDFREHVPYQVYDITAQLRRGQNALAAYLAPGWYSTPLRWFGQGNNYGPTQPALRAQLRLQYADGTVAWIPTDASWKAANSPILQAEIYDGETMDARLIQPGWDTPGFADAAWNPAMLVSPKEPAVVAEFYPPIRAERVLTANAITHPAPGVAIFDFGQNMSAVPRLRVRGERGQQITMRFGEVLNPDGTLYTENLRTAKATDRFILAGGAIEEYQPRFTFHGFRYAEITGLPEPATKDTLKAVVLHTDAPFTTRFSTGNPMVNQLWSNILWGQRSNFVGVPTDCPQRDERLGWSADAQVFWRTAAFNMDLSTFSRKYAADLHGTQQGTAMYGIFAPGVDVPNPGFGAAWSDAGVIVPWTSWMQTGDTRIIQENWDGMEAYLAEILRGNPDHLWRNAFGNAFGDWLTPTITTPQDLLATAYWAYDVSLMRQMATATGRNADAERFAAEFAGIKRAFQKAFVRDDGFVGTVDRYPSIPPPTLHPEAGGARERPVETQTGYVLALAMDLLPPDLRAAASDRLVKKIEENHWLLGTGFLGTPYLLEVLSDTGHTDVAYRLLLNRAYPSWGYLIDHGATTTWERWNGDAMRGDPSMNSYNHYAYGAVAEWLYRYAAGIDTSPAGGFHAISLRPHFDSRIGHLNFAYDSSYGTVESNWVVTGDRVTWTLTVPPNTTATLSPSATNAERFLLEGNPLNQSPKVRPGAPDSFILPAGRYNLIATLKIGGSDRP